MAEGETHKRLKLAGMLWLKKRVIDLVAMEVDFHNIRSIADVVGVNLKRKEIRVIECKASKVDLRRDEKLFSEKYTYLNHANFSYIMCPRKVLTIEDIPQGYGLLWVDEYNSVEVVKNPSKNKNKLKTLFETTLKNSVRSITNMVLFKKENEECKDPTNKKYSKKAEIFLVSAICKNCRHSTKELIFKNVTKTIICNHCGKEINLKEHIPKEIMGFNKTFLNRIKELQRE